ncbi:hypothetical protein A9Q84_10300 [Halobacteriovorax marinus]|uniref:FAD:protein FMN transferase n=1 Tax=Halobacteriovorax marinus TaxID=97084 RepID=A0A1Y5F754_9BACT|nr:hypothetical protein A9Q84_10300 [Halobacteriovorax marinus]
MTSLIQVQKKIMNCMWDIKCYPQTHLSKERSLELIEEAFLKAIEIENYFSVFKDSPFNKINDQAGTDKVKVSRECIDILLKAKKYYRETDGNFNIAFLGLEGFRDASLIEVDEDNLEVYLPYSEMKISLGGMGKGYAVDVVHNFLVSHGLINFLINGSGDLKSHSHPNAPRAWRVGITNPFNLKNTIGQIEIKNSAVATSGQYKKRDHIQSTHLNLPLSVTILGATTMECDIWGTYISTLSIPEGLRALNRSKQFGFIVDQSGKCHQSRRSYRSFQQVVQRGVHG